MMRSLFSGVTGLRTHQTKMDVIGNNISNVNTLGYKKSQANFSDIYSQTVSPSSAPSGSNGGINAKQVGLGVQMASIQIKHSAGAAQYTGNTLDLAIQGDGFFAVRTNADGRERYTRAGNLSISSNGSLVTSAGNFVQCFAATYQQGTAGAASTTGFTGADGEPKSAAGISGIQFLPDYGGIVNTASGTYSLEIAGNSTSVNLMKNGITIAENIPIQAVLLDDTGAQTLADLTVHQGFRPNTRYQIDLSQQGLGTIEFTTDGHSVSSNITQLSTDYFKSGSFVENTNALNQADDEGIFSYPTGTYSFNYENGTLTMNGPEGDVALGGAPISIVDQNGNEVGDGEDIPAGSTMTIETPIGTMTFGVSSGIADADKETRFNELFDSIRMTVAAGRGEGPANFTTGIASLNGLLTGASISVTNNDGYQAAATRGDMIINQDLFENVSISSDGAVIGQLKANTTGAELEREAGIIGAEDMAAGEKVVLGYVALATFANAEGLEKVGDNLYELTSNSGRAMYYTPGTGGTGAIASSSLEMSNVDLSEEMVNMITTQRGFQANSRIITTSDTMLEELINLKR